MKKPKSDPHGCTLDIMAMIDTLEVLGGKWKLLIIHYLMTREQEANTFKKMEKDITGISAKMLSKELKTLEANKLVSRQVMDTRPITIQYAITEYGKETRLVIQTLVSWGLTHRLKMFEDE